MALKTPPLHAKGLYSVKAPYSLVSSTLYECMAIRSFQDLIDLGQDILALYYTPVGLTQVELDADAKVGANIITLMSVAQPTIHLPDTYILSYPNMGNVAYSNLVLSFDLGVVPDTLDLTFLMNQLAGVTSDTVGIAPTVTPHVGMSSNVVTQTQADALEVARQAAVSNRKTDRASLLTLQGQYTTLQAQYAGVVAILKANGLLPSP